MQTTGSFDTRAYGSVEDCFSGPEYGSYDMGCPMAYSPIQSSVALPGGDPSSWMQSTSGIYATPQGAGSIAMSPDFLNEHTLSSFHAQFDPPDERYTFTSNFQESGATISVTQQPSPLFSSMIHDDLQSPSSFVVPTPAMPPYSPYNGSLDRVLLHSYHSENLIPVEEPQPFDPVMHPLHQEIQPAPADGVTRTGYIPLSPTIQATVPLVPLSPMTRVPTRRDSRGAPSTPSSPYRPTRASSFSVQSVSPSDIVLHTHTCGWTNDDGSICMAPISSPTISDHLITHGITNMKHDRYIPCRWIGCRLRGGADLIKRESIVRHIREKHLQCRRSSN